MKPDTEWIKYFKYTVNMARNYRLDGRIDSAKRIDQLIERYYAESKSYGYDESQLFEIETDIRNREVKP